MQTRKEQLERLMQLHELIYQAQERLANKINHNQRDNIILPFSEHEIQITERAFVRLKQAYNYAAMSLTLFRTNSGLPKPQQEPFTNC